jgi:ribosomal protein L29
MKVQELRNLSKEELLKKVAENAKAVQDRGFERRYTRVEKPHLIKAAKKEIARIKTILKEQA